MTQHVNGSSPQPAWHGRFLQLLPAIRSYARFAFRHLNPEAREEAVSEAVAAALVAYVRLIERGKEDVVYAKPLAHYAVCHVRNGRHVGGRASSTDALSRQAQRRRGFRVGRIGGVDEHEDKWVERIVAEDRRATPADIAATRIDFREWLKSLSRRRRRVAQELASGENTNSVASTFGVTPARVSQLRRELHESWQAFQGEAAGIT